MTKKARGEVFSYKRGVRLFLLGVGVAAGCVKKKKKKKKKKKTFKIIAYNLCISDLVKLMHSLELVK